MKEFDLSVELLIKILVDDVPFQLALKNKFSAEKGLANYRQTVSTVVGCVLRHNILFSFLLKDIELTEEEKIKASVALGNAYFAKRLPEDEVLKELKDTLDETKFNKVKDLIDNKDNPENYIPESVKKGSLQYLSLRFNTPEWVLKIWKHFGISTTYKLLRKNLKPATNSLRVRDSQVEISDILKDESFVESNVPNIVYYRNKLPLRKNGFFIRNELFLEKAGIKYILDKFKLESDNSEVFLYNGNQNPAVALEIIETYKERIGINIGVLDKTSYASIAKSIAFLNLKNVNYFQANPLSMEAYISNPQDLVIAFPKSTNFDSIRDVPDYLLHFKKEIMDEIINSQKEILEGCSKYVADQGNLLYIVPTISTKECSKQVEEFLSKNPDFNLVEEKQMFPFDEYETSVYYALLHRGMPVAKATMSPNAIISDPATNNVARASAKEN